MLLFLMSKDPVLSTVSVRECSLTVFSVHLSQTGVQWKTRCIQAKQPFQHKKGLWFPAILSSGITICEVL